MRKMKLILPFLLTAAIASSCAEGTENDTAEAVIPEITSAETQHESEVSEISETQPESETKASESEEIFEENVGNSGEKLSELSVAEVGIIGHTEKFDDIVPCKFSLGEAIEPDPAALETAVNAYRQTDYYKDALEMMKLYYSYNDGGELVESEDMYFVARYAKEMLMESAAPEVDIDAVPVYSYKVGDGHLIVLMVVLPDGLFSWSGTGIAHIPIYVNGSGEAFVLDEACSQDYADCCTLEYEDGSIHAVMDYGHNMGGMLSAVYSFEGGVPKPEIIGWDHFLIEKDMPVLFRYNSAYMREIFFWNDKAGQYCMAGGAAPDDELARAICSDETVLSEIPEAWELYQNNRLKIFGGRYITFYKSNGYTYSLDSQTGALAEDKTVILFSDDSELPEDIKYYNIDLT